MALASLFGLLHGKAGASAYIASQEALRTSRLRIIALPLHSWNYGLWLNILHTKASLLSYQSTGQR